MACFDTAFHATLPAAAATYALPRAWRERCGLRRFGFHGLSHAYAVAAALGGARAWSSAATSAPAPRWPRCAAAARVDTTMGFTPLEGLVMATRSGSVDPGLVLWLLRHGVDADDGRATASSTSAACSGWPATPTCATRRWPATTPTRAWPSTSTSTACARAIAAMAAALGGLDALVFTGGVGRARARGAGGGRRGPRLPRAWRSTRRANAAASADADLTARGAAARTLVVTAREDLEMAREVRALLEA